MLKNLNAIEEKKYWENGHFKKYTQAKNQIINIKAPAYIKDLPNENEIKKLFEEIESKDIKPYEFEVKKGLIKEDLANLEIEMS